MLFYVHQNAFASGINAFNKTAETVNHLQPRTQWRSLGEIVRHLYLEKLRTDGNYDIRAYASTIHVDNRHKRDVRFFVEKEEDFSLPLTVFVDGEPYPYYRSGTRLCLELPIRDGMSREVSIKYANDLNVAGVDISKTSLRVYAIRRLSDFRDNVVSKTALGRRFIRSYSERGDYWNGVAAVFAVMLAAIALGWLYVHTNTRRSMLQNMAPRMHDGS
jgi:hypothetical protein